MTDHRIICGDSLHVLPTLDAESVDAIVCDPPYGLSFMGKDWDHGVPGEAFWREALRVAKPGAHLVAFGGTRTYHRLACAIEDAGWEIRDCLSWLYGSGFPKSLDVSKAMDKRGGYPHIAAQIGDALRAARESRGLTVGECDRTFCGGTTNWSWFEGRPKGQRAPTPQTFAAIAEAWPEVAHLADAVAEAEREVVGRGKSGIGTAFGEGEWARGEAQEFAITAPATDLARQWQGWGTALKPAWEPIILARKPLVGTVASNVAQYGTGAVNVDGCRIGGDPFVSPRTKPWFSADKGWNDNAMTALGAKMETAGRWPANVVLDEEAAGLFPESRFFYTAKASRREREAGLEGMPEREGGIKNDSGRCFSERDPYAKITTTNNHPTVKPIALMRWLCRLVTPPNGLVLDPFTGSGSTGCAAVLEGLRFVGVECEPEYAAIAEKRIAHWAGQRAEPSLFDG